MYDSVLSNLSLDNSYMISQIVSATIVIFLSLSIVAGFVLIYGNKSKLHALAECYFSKGMKTAIPVFFVVFLGFSFSFETASYKAEILNGQKVIYNISIVDEKIGEVEYKYCQTFASWQNCEYLEVYKVILKDRGLLEINGNLTFNDIMTSNKVLMNRVN